MIPAAELVIGNIVRRVLHIIREEMEAEQVRPGRCGGMCTRPGACCSCALAGKLLLLLACRSPSAGMPLYPLGAASHDLCSCCAVQEEQDDDLMAGAAAGAVGVC